MPCAAHAKTLSIGGTGCALAEVPRERQFVVVVDDLSASFGVGFVANVMEFSSALILSRPSTMRTSGN
jgi:hypothetical protein